MRQTAILILIIGFGPILDVSAQTDSVAFHKNLNEVIVTSAIGGNRKKTSKGNAASIDENLKQFSDVNMIRRGGYAWEPVINNMSTERISTTIDGMKIFYACTDKMDPVTSYVETDNLQRISLNSGLDGNPQATGNIGGSLDLKLRKIGFNNTPSAYHLLSGYESNGNMQVYSADAQFSGNKFYTNFGVSRRYADNYKAGDNQTVQFSQFHKNNVFFNIGLRPVDNHILEGTFIYDLATDVGYPALKMDVKRAEGIIGAIAYRQEHMKGLFSNWETKLYANRIVHIMDDTKRSDVEIHMDMPGRSRTSGLYSLLKGSRGIHQYKVNYDIYYNTLHADMTMYPVDKESPPMYMLTWPDVGTFNTGISLADDILFLGSHSLHVSLKGSYQNRYIGSDEGFHALSIYFPGMPRSNSEYLWRSSASYRFDIQHLHISVGAGYGNRAPSVTESSGYFLNNTFDRYDYIGNPHLKKESALELNGLTEWNDNKADIKVEANVFLFQNYIIGKPDSRLSPMTIGAAGVKIYQNLNNARIMNIIVTGNYNIYDWLRLENCFRYSYGVESTGSHLPLIAPFTYNGAIKTVMDKFEAEAAAECAANHSDYSAKYGETQTPGYVVFRISAGYHLDFKSFSVDIHTGIENILDRKYTTYSDWNHILEKGRNIFVNASFTI